MDNTKQIKTPEQWLIDEGYPVSMPISRDTIADIINQYVHQHPVPDASQPAGTETYLIYNNDKVNSMLSVALKNLDNEQLEVLRDCLIERTPQPAGNDAVGFAEWILKNAYWYESAEKWYLNDMVENRNYTTTELHNGPYQGYLKILKK